MTPAHDAAAVLRNVSRQAALRQQLASLERDLQPHARRLCDANGYAVMLREPALVSLAEQVAKRSHRVPA